MNHPATQAVVKPDHQSKASTHLQGSWLVLARIAWIVLALFTLIMVFASFPAYFVKLHTLCAGAACDYGQLSLTGMRALHALGLSLDSYAIGGLALALIWTGVWAAVGVVIFWRKSDDWMALLVALFLVLGSQGLTTRGLEQSHLVWQWPTKVSLYLAAVVFALFMALFPSGRFVPSFTRWLVIAWLLVAMPAIFWLNSSVNLLDWTGMLEVLLIAGIMVGLVIAQVSRYWRISSPVQRQQTRWIVFAGVASIAVPLVAFLATAPFLPAFVQPGSLYTAFFFNGTAIVALLIPLSIGIAVLRYRLWDIDLIIHRTLVYSILTVTLTVIYGVLLLALQALMRQLTGQASENPVVVVASTLVIAALFQPLRRNIQAFIDRRFYRRKYDAAQTLAAFSATLRHEVDLDQLREALIAVVQETMQPAHVSLWLRPLEHQEKRQFPWSVNPPVPSEEG